jgi:hypothetical protein
VQVSIHHRPRFILLLIAGDVDINNVIAHGIENAKCAIVVSSPEFQENTLCMKAVCYADQCKIPMMSVNSTNDWQPSSWLGAILSALPNLTLESLHEGLIPLIIEVCTAEGMEAMKGRAVNPAAEQAAHRRPGPSTKDLFSGGLVEGWYYDAYLEMKASMTYDFFRLANGSVMGQGSDSVGIFTIKGEYTLKTRSVIEEYDITFVKQYVGRHAVIYKGVLISDGPTAGFTISGEHNYGGAFEIAGGNAIAMTHLNQPLETERIEEFPSQYWTIVLVSAPEDEELCKTLRDSLAALGHSTDDNVRSVAVIRPFIALTCMLRACAKADIIIPLMTTHLENNDTAMQVLTWCDKSKKKIVPAKGEGGSYQQRGWLGALTAGMLWFDVALPSASQDEERIRLMKTKAHALLHEARAQTSADTLAEDVPVKAATGWYFDPVHHDRFPMVFDFFELIGGVVTGKGQDAVDPFVLSGTYVYSPDDGGSIQFLKSYVGQHTHEVHYSGRMDPRGDTVVVTGEHNYGGEFELTLSGSSAAGDGHIMISYQWGSQPIVKRVVEGLKQRGMDVWFDIDGDMKGNINVAMAEGVERAHTILSFHTMGYAKSVNCKKELAYAAVLQKPILPVNLNPTAFDYSNDSSSEQYWITAILNKAEQKIAPLLYKNESDCVEQICATIDTTPCCILPPPAPPPLSLIDEVETPFSRGGEVKGWYVEPSNGAKCDMMFTYFRMYKGSILGQGDDTVSPFIISGEYFLSGGDDGSTVEWQVRFSKQYCGRHNHVVLYEGMLNGNRIEGMHNYGGAFEILAM